LKLCGLSKPVRALFELVRMHRIFDICDSKDDAIHILQT
jgi:anti-sigma B factor antagonist